MTAMPSARTARSLPAPTRGPSPIEELLDVRAVLPAERHAKIFGAFGALRPGGAFVLVNDHDPKPLYYQFRAERDGEFTWEYLVAGPVVWRVRIGKTVPSTS